MKKKLLPLMIGMLFFSLCASCAPDEGEDRAAAIRDYFAGMDACSATVLLTADFGDRAQDFTLKLRYEKNRDTTVEILAPAEVAGVTARIDGTDSQLFFEDVVLETGPLPGGGLTPVDALPTMLRVWADGYLLESGEEKLSGVKVYHLTWRNMVGETEIIHHGWFDRESFHPLRAEVLSDGTLIISCDFELFEAA